MATSRNILAQNIVLVTENVNPSLFNMVWFIQNNIFHAEDILPDSVCVPGFTSISTPICQITIVPNQVQMAIKTDNVEVSKLCVTNSFKKVIQSLAALPIKGIGINFVWKVSDNDTDFHSYTSRLFANNESNLHSYFSQEDSRMGAYFSQNVDDTTRLKLDIKPVTADDNAKITEFLFCAFNYHCDVNIDNSKDRLTAQLDKWEEFLNSSRKIVCLIS